MENNKKSQEVQIKKEVPQPTTLFEDMNGHKHDKDSYEKLMREQTNIRKNTETKTGI